MEVETGSPSSANSELRKRVLAKVKKLSSSSVDSPLPNEYWSPLLFACALGDLSCVQYLVQARDCDTNKVPDGKISPKISSVHMSAIFNNSDIMKCVITPKNVNIQDQWGFTALHYAVVYRSIDVIELLLYHGADMSLLSTTGNSALDLAQSLNFTEIVDILASSVQLKEDPLVKKFGQWLRSVGAGAYVSSFIRAGYDLEFIAKQGLSSIDLNCVGIPNEQLGVRRKLETLHNIHEFFVVEEDSEGSGSEDDSASEESDEES